MKINHKYMEQVDTWRYTMFTTLGHQKLLLIVGHLGAPQQAARHASKAYSHITAYLHIQQTWSNIKIALDSDELNSNTHSLSVLFLLNVMIHCVTAS